MGKIKLHFHGPFTFLGGERSLFHSEYAKDEGIYLWIIKQEKSNANFIHYVGETTNFAKRQREHIIHILSLDYMILDVHAAKNGIRKELWNGMWRDKSENAVLRTIENYTEVSKYVIDYIKIIDVFFAPTELPNDIRKHIEGSIGWNLRNNHPEYKTFYPDDNQVGTKSEKLGDKLLISCDEIIMGLDSVIMI